jgi:hypothetical protein
MAGGYGINNLYQFGQIKSAEASPALAAIEPPVLWTARAKRGGDGAFLSRNPFPSEAILAAQKSRERPKIKTRVARKCLQPGFRNEAR